jgi:hypothetical protein
MAPNNGKQREQDPEDFIDPKGYWADPERNIRRTSGGQEIVLNECDQRMHKRRGAFPTRKFMNRRQRLKVVGRLD